MDARRHTTMLADLLDAEGRVDADAWTRAHTSRAPVARCGCGGPVVSVPGHPWEEHWGQRWYAMECEQCGHGTEVTASRVMPSTTRWSSQLLDAHAEVERRRLADA